MKNQKGFSLIELLIVVVIIGIIAAIAIPNLLAARRSANEGSAISAMRTLHGGEMTYQATTGSGQYGTLLQLGSANILDSGLSNGNKSGYAFTAVIGASSNTIPATFAVRGLAQTTSGITQTGTRNFAIATEGVVYYTPAANTVTLTAGTTTAASTFGGTGLTVLNN